MYYNSTKVSKTSYEINFLNFLVFLKDKYIFKKYICFVHKKANLIMYKRTIQ